MGLQKVSELLAALLKTKDIVVPGMDHVNSFFSLQIFAKVDFTEMPLPFCFVLLCAHVQVFDVIDVVEDFDEGSVAQQVELTAQGDLLL